jgi:hypothetical protein
MSYIYNHLSLKIGAIQDQYIQQKDTKHVFLPLHRMLKWQKSQSFLLNLRFRIFPKQDIFLHSNKFPLISASEQIKESPLNFDF